MTDGILAWVAERKEQIIMATLTKDKRTGTFVIQWYEGKRRLTLSLPGRKYRQKTAEMVKEVVESLIYHRYNGIIIPDKTLARRIEFATPDLQAKLAKVGLISVSRLKTCQELWDTCLKHKTDIKESSMRIYQVSKTKFFETFSFAEPIESITTERLLEWKTSLLTRHAPASVAGYIKTAKMVFGWAVDQEWLAKDPLKNIPKGSFINRDNDRIISMEEYAKLLDACSNQTWRTIIALARIGGLRCPSELKRLKWSDVNWAENRFVVRASKTERHERHRERIVPLFPELRVVLDQHFFSLDETEENEFVIEQYHRSSWNLGTPFQQIAHRAGLGTIKRPFDNMRMSRSNEVLNRWGQAKESLWIGHSAKVMQDHYLRLSDADFLEAAGEDLTGQKSHAKSHAILQME
ncbi:MAG: tyrosine-type recombinase/integrase [Planctomycetaceae bacterium]|jgi:integrase|nr:tyrosine-type recombinase/integrase [Planctomycetaceae bacterium]